MFNIFSLLFDFNSLLWYSILFTIIFISLVFLDRMLFNLIPNIIVGLFGLLALGSWIYYFLNNFIRNLWASNVGKAIIFAVSFIILSIILTTNFSKKKTAIGGVISPTKWGKNIKNITRHK